MNRIRYSKNGNRLESVKTFNHETNGARYRIILEEASGSWYVVDAEGGAVAANGQETSLHKVKVAAKAALEKLGISFLKEGRMKKTPMLSLVVPEISTWGDAENTGSGD